MSDSFAFPVPPERTLDGTLGIETLEVTLESARSRARVADHVKQPWGLVHGGVFAAMAESLASQATARAVYDDGNIAVGLSNYTSFMRPILEGHLNAEARRVHRGRTTWIWDVDVTDDEGRLCATSRVTIAVRPAPA